MGFRIAGHFDVEVVAGFLPDEFHQLIGVAIETRRAATGGDVSAQRYQPFDPGAMVALQQLTHVGFIGAGEGEVRSHLGPGRPVFQHQLAGAGAGRAAGSVGHRKVFRAERRQFGVHGIQPGFPLRSARRVKLNAKRRVGGIHAGVSLVGVTSTCSCRS